MWGLNKKRERSSLPEVTFPVGSIFIWCVFEAGFPDRPLFIRKKRIYECLQEQSKRLMICHAPSFRCLARFARYLGKKSDDQSQKRGFYKKQRGGSPE